MKFIFRVHKHTQIEIDSWRKIGFTTITDNNFSEYGVISATANLNFMSPLNATLTAINLHSDKLSDIVDKVNERDSLYLYTQSKPNLILVPNNKGDSLKKSGADYYTTQILSFCNFYRYKYLHFTHFGFINGFFQSEEISKILNIFLNPLIHKNLDIIYFEIDSSHLQNLQNIFYDISNRIYRLNIHNVEVIYAQEFEFVEPQKTISGYTSAQFRPKEN